MTRGPLGAPLLVVTILCTTGFVLCREASADAFRCTVDGRTTYTDRPCTAGRQAQISIDPATPSSSDRAAAEERSRLDARALADLRRERLANEQVRAVSGKTNAASMRRARECARLAVRARRAREDYEHAGPRDQAQKQIRLRRAEEDRVAACPAR